MFLPFDDEGSDFTSKIQREKKGLGSFAREKTGEKPKKKGLGGENGGKVQENGPF